MAWNASTLTASLRVEATANPQNYAVQLHHVELRQAAHRDREPLKRRKKDPQRPDDRRSTRIQDPPEPPWRPETFTLDARPDRPLSNGGVLQTGNFEGGTAPTGFSTQTSGVGAFTTDPLAAITGTLGGRFRKATSGALAESYIYKSFASTHPALANRHDLGAYAKMKWNVLPSQRAKLTTLRNVAQARNIAWIESSSMSEQVKLTLTEDPVEPGNPTITLDNTRYTLPNTANFEVQQITVSSSPTGAGSPKVGPGGAPLSIPVGGDEHWFSFIIGRSPTATGTLKYTINGTTYSIAVTKGQTANSVATAIKNKGISGYKIYGPYGDGYMDVQATTIGSRPTPTFDANGTGCNPSSDYNDNGACDTATQFAAKIRGTYFPGWTTSGTGTQVIFTATTLGDKPAPSTSTNGTPGVAFTSSTTTAGANLNATALATSIRAQTFTGWTTSGTGTEVIFTATSGGVRQKSRYRDQGTGALGTMRTLRQGSNATITAHVKDRFNDEDAKRIMLGVGSGVVFNTDVTISGAGTSRAVVSFWGSTGTSALQLLARFEDVDLGGTDEEDFGLDNIYVDRVRFGVSEEEGTADLWDLFMDSIQVTDRGKKFYRDHNAIGEWLPQVFYHAPKGTPVQKDLLLQDGRVSAIPGDTYTLGAFLRARMDQTTPLRPLVATAHRRDKHGKALRYELGDVTNTAGLTGVNPWAEYSLTFEMPEDCYHVTLESKGVGAAEVVVQEVTLSPGPTAKRTYLYQTSGQYVATQHVETPDTDENFKFWTSDIVHIDANIHEELDEATGNPLTSSTVEFRSADPLSSDPTQPDPATYTSWQTNWKLVPEKDFVQTRVTMTGPGHLTNAIPAGDPHVEYLNRFGKKKISVFLNKDRSEIPGGTAFEQLEEFTKREPQGRKRLPSGHLYDEPTLFEPVGHLPEYTLLVYTSEGREYIEENWREDFVIEQYGRHVLRVKLAEQPEFKRETITVNQVKGQRYGIWKAKIAPNEVTAIAPFKERSDYP